MYEHEVKLCVREEKSLVDDRMLLAVLTKLEACFAPLVFARQAPAAHL